MEGPDITKVMKRPLREANCDWGNPSWRGRLAENGEAMDKKRIEGRRDATSWHNTAKPHRSVVPGGKSDVCAVKQRVVRFTLCPVLSPVGLGTYLGPG